MPVKHTNRKGHTFFLHRRTDRAGRARYFFSRKSDGDLPEGIPEGFEIYENPNAQVFLRKIQPKLIADEELRVVEEEIQRLPHLRYYRVDVKKNIITIFAPNQDVDGMRELLSRFPGLVLDRPEELIAQTLSYSPILRFVLVDDRERAFQTQRYCFRGSIDDWIVIGGPGPLPKQARRFVKHLGQESFFELF